MIPNPTLPTANTTRTFTFDRHGQITTNDPVTTYEGQGGWGISTVNGGTNTSQQGRDSNNTGGNSYGSGTGNTDEGVNLLADFGRISAAPTYDTMEVWTLVNAGDGWDHPIHIHFEEGYRFWRATATATTTTSLPAASTAMPPWEQGRKDVYRLRPGGSVTVALQFRDWGGMFMEHCHNTMHEDNAMLLRWEINNAGGVFLNPLPTPIPSPNGVTAFQIAGRDFGRRLPAVQQHHQRQWRRRRWRRSQPLTDNPSVAAHGNPMAAAGTTSLKIAAGGHSPASSIRRGRGGGP